MDENKLEFQEILTEVEKGDPGVVSPAKIRHLSIRWVLMSLLGIIFIWGTIILVAYIVKMPQAEDFSSKVGAEVYTQLMNAHNQRFKDLAQLSFMVLIPVFSTLAGSYIRGGDEG